MNLNYKEYIEQLIFKLQKSISSKFYNKEQIDHKFSNINISEISQEQLMILKSKLDALSPEKKLCDIDRNILTDINNNAISE